MFFEWIYSKWIILLKLDESISGGAKVLVQNRLNLYEVVKCHKNSHSTMTGMTAELKVNL